MYMGEQYAKRPLYYGEIGKLDYICLTYGFICRILLS
jgi:hypothetical protein